MNAYLSVLLELLQLFNLHKSCTASLILANTARSASGSLNSKDKIYISNSKNRGKHTFL